MDQVVAPRRGDEPDGVVQPLPAPLRLVVCELRVLVHRPTLVPLGQFQQQPLGLGRVVLVPREGVADSQVPDRQGHAVVLRLELGRVAHVRLVGHRDPVLDGLLAERDDSLVSVAGGVVRLDLSLDVLDLGLIPDGQGMLGGLARLADQLRCRLGVQVRGLHEVSRQVRRERARHLVQGVQVLRHEYLHAVDAAQLPVLVGLRVLGRILRVDLHDDLVSLGLVGEQLRGLLGPRQRERLRLVARHLDGDVPGLGEGVLVVALEDAHLRDRQRHRQGDRDLGGGDVVDDRPDRPTLGEHLRGLVPAGVQRLRVVARHVNGRAELAQGGVVVGPRGPGRCGQRDYGNQAHPYSPGKAAHRSVSCH